ncbi:hypothetical protein BW723_09745 [Polaribacter reichenbachii]|uniref:Glycosyl transferase family 28 C-terminal domain-containing protein n=1 Tax=Polaribacter reichenbachii TaxID=996801 RepID=A0A1B8U3D4_9FLAO|nr:glycosyltransferase [Polaribacter reichenbachii]APZ46553.1 hypothetical protein BW723_09745 [Polaribacter reichenbachii]AUC17199.1 hypothetical protein BTO17_00195 [Polaribacter reichenbachii]OBY66377.1 hypothetical protein LPB301_06710 [Polaribacter reichenbachii]
MIFVTIGTQEPFDRLIQGIDNISGELKLDVIAQVSSGAKITINNMKVYGFLSPDEFAKYFDKAELIVAHAGMGTIISALVKNKKLIVFPREKKLGEHRSDHQIATAKYFEEMGYITVARTIDELKEQIEITLGLSDSKPNDVIIGKYASKSLIESLRNEIGLS